MARITTVKKARKEQGNCERCGKLIALGDSYKWCAPGPPRMQRKRRRCADCPTWRPSELTGSSQLATLYAAQEAYDDADKSSPEAWGEALTDLASGVREAGEGYTESAQNMEDGFGHATSMSEELEEKGSELDGWADEIESAASDIEGLEMDSCSECDEVEEEHHDFDQETIADPGDAEYFTPGPNCTVCKKSEDDGPHHEFEPSWEREAEDLAGIADDAPI